MPLFLFLERIITIQHASIADPNIHEPKGVNVAAANTSYLANGAGSGSWSKITTQGMSGISGNGTANQVLIVDGSGAFSLAWPTAHGFTYFINIGSPSVITYPSVYTKVNPTTTAEGNPREFTEATTARLTYTGTPARHATVSAFVDLSQGSGADKDVRIAIYKNGTIIASSETILTTTTASKRQLRAMCTTPCVTNDYFEAYVKNDGASGDITVYALKLAVQADLS